MIDLINVSSGKCWSSEFNNPVDTAATGFDGGFGIALIKKYFKRKIDTEEEVGVRLQIGERYEAEKDEQEHPQFA